MKGRDDTTTFLPLDSRIGGQKGDSCPTVGQYLTRPNKLHILKGRNWRDDKHEHDTARDRTRKTAK